MAFEKVPVSFRSDENFRKGACHGAEWFLETVQTLVSQGRTAGEIAEHLADLVRVLEEWRSQTGAVPDGNPWDWSFHDLSSVIKDQKDEEA
ncbi:MAG: hypothetical protein V4710_06290 [Verrucomicrobiota bacterium]